jgi:hypothetical protein
LKKHAELFVKHAELLKKQSNPNVIWPLTFEKTRRTFCKTRRTFEKTIKPERDLTTNF